METGMSLSDTSKALATIDAEIVALEAKLQRHESQCDEARKRIKALKTLAVYVLEEACNKHFDWRPHGPRA